MRRLSPFLPLWMERLSMIPLSKRPGEVLSMLFDIRRVISPLRNCSPMANPSISGGQCLELLHRYVVRPSKLNTAKPPSVFPADQWYQVSRRQPSGTRANNSLITYYLTSVLEDMDLGPEMSRIIAGVNGTVYFLTSYASSHLIHVRT